MSEAKLHNRSIRSEKARPMSPAVALGQVEEPGTSDEARSREGLGKGALAMSCGAGKRPKPDQIYGPKNDGTYILEFMTADGEALAISVHGTRRRC
jgi:hypothetical protein